MTATALAQVSDGPSLALYDAMCRAIDAAYSVDEVKDIRDKAVAIEVYARQAKNTEAERRACEIRLRAERKAGTLLAGMGEKRGGPKSRDATLLPLGVSKTQSSKWQQLAAVPEAQFEAALAAPEKPSTAGIIKKPTPPMNPLSLWLWGRLRDFERDGMLDAAPQQILSEMTEAMRADVRRLLPRVIQWLSEANADAQ